VNAPHLKRHPFLKRSGEKDRAKSAAEGNAQNNYQLFIVNYQLSIFY
jgi:hypothetical protein